MASPDIPLLASDLKALIWPWSKTNLGIMSRFQEAGQWHIGDENQYWYFSPAFAGLAATMFKFDNSLVLYRKLAVETVEQSFKWNLNEPVVTAPRFAYPLTPLYPTTVFTGLNLDGASRPIAKFDAGPWGLPDPVGSDENGTIEASASICWIIDALFFAPDGYTPSGGIDLPTAERWLQNIKYAADWLIDWNGNPIWYTNGNYVAHEALLFAHLSMLCRKIGAQYSSDDPRAIAHEASWARYSQAYELTMQTLIYPQGNALPASAQWANYGYTVDIAGSGSGGTGVGTSALLTPGGTVSDGSSETGHFTETPSHSTITPGVTNTFDGAYTLLQMDILATLFLVNRDWRVNYILNAIWNKLEPLTNFSTYVVNCNGGSRQSGNRGWNGGYQNVISMLSRRSLNRTNLTNAICTGGWSSSVAPNLSTNSSIDISLMPTGSARNYRIGVATTLHACYQADNKLA